MTLRLALLSILVLACDPVTVKGDIDGGNNNGGDGGGDTPDAMPAFDAAPGTATVRVLDDDHAPLANARVLFSNRDGSQISVQTTNASGEASETVNEGAIVTVAVAEQFDAGSSANYYLYQVHDVQPGDQVEIGPRGAAADWSDLGSANVELRDTLPGGVDHYEVGTGCNNYYISAGQPLTVSYQFYNDECHGRNTTRDLLGYAFDANDVPIAWTTVDGVELGANLVVAEPWSTEFDDVTVTASNVPFSGALGMRLRQFRGGIDYSIDSSEGGGQVTMGGSVAAAHKLPRGFADALQVSAQGFSSSGADAVIAFVIRNVARSSTSHSINFDSLGYPSFTQVQVSLSTPNAPRVTWTETGSPPAAFDARIAYVSWENPNNNDEWQWQVLLPPGASSPVVSPTLPPSFLLNPITGGNAWPPPPGTPTQTIAAGMIEIGDLEGWQAVRQGRGLAVFGDGDGFLSPSAPVGATTVLWAGGQLNIN